MFWKINFLIFQGIGISVSTYYSIFHRNVHPHILFIRERTILRNSSIRLLLKSCQDDLLQNSVLPSILYISTYIFTKHVYRWPYRVKEAFVCFLSREGQYPYSKTKSFMGNFEVWNFIAYWCKVIVIWSPQVWKRNVVKCFSPHKIATCCFVSTATKASANICFHSLASID